MTCSDSVEFKQKFQNWTVRELDQNFDHAPDSAWFTESFPIFWNNQKSFADP